MSNSYDTDLTTAYETANQLSARGFRSWVERFATLGNYKGVRLVITDGDDLTCEAYILDGEWHDTENLPAAARGYLR